MLLILLYNTIDAGFVEVLNIKHLGKKLDDKPNLLEVQLSSPSKLQNLTKC